jgi:signal transduction histidine kinase
VEYGLITGALDRYDSGSQEEWAFVDRILAGREIKFRLVWFVTMRYAATMVLMALPLATHVVGLDDFEAGFVWPCAAGLIIYNSAMLWLLNGVRFTNWRRAGVKIAHTQIALDFVFLTAILHYTGGSESPVLFFYVFHAIIASILLTRIEAFVHVAVGTVMVLAVAALEYTGVIEHHALGLMEGAPYQHAPFVLGILGFYTIMMFLTVYMTSSIAREIGVRERIVSEIVSRLQLANAELQKQEKTRIQFVRTVAHDLKEPLASIQSTLRVVLDGYTGEIPDKSRDMIARADRSSKKLIAMIRDMLDLGRMRSGWVGNASTWTARNLGETVEEKLEPLAESRQQTIRREFEPPDLALHASFDAFEQIMLNLISNGIKYSPDHHGVTYRMAHRGDELVIAVEDEGIGISAEDQERLFTEFFRADNARRMTRAGTGLGLSIVRTIIGQYQGSIEVESPYDGREDGTRFIVRIPWSEVSQ